MFSNIDYSRPDGTCPNVLSNKNLDIHCKCVTSSQSQLQGFQYNSLTLGSVPCIVIVKLKKNQLVIVSHGYKAEESLMLCLLNSTLLELPADL